MSTVRMAMQGPWQQAIAWGAEMAELQEEIIGTPILFGGNAVGSTDTVGRWYLRERVSYVDPVCSSPITPKFEWSGSYTRTASAGTNETTGFAPTFRAGPALVAQLDRAVAS